MRKEISLLFILFTGCVFNNKDEKLSRIQLNDISGINQKFEYAIEKISDSVVPIPLETNEHCLIKEISEIQESKDFLWILSDGKLYQFTSKGKFVRMVGAVGQGPEEYISVWDIHVNNQQEQVNILDYFGRKILVYNFSGKLLSTQSLPEGYSYNAIYGKERDLYLYSISNAIFPDLLLCKGNQFDTISISERTMGKEGFLGNTYMYSINEEIGLYHYFNDTIYRLQNQKLVPKYLLDLGKLKYSFAETELGEDFSPKLKIAGSRLQIMDCFETSDYLFLHYMLNEYEGVKSVPFLFLYDKINSIKYDHVNLVCSEIPEFSIRNGKKIRYSDYSNCLIASFQIEEINHFAEKIGADISDNPVIVKYHLK